MATHGAVAHDYQTLIGRLHQAREETDALFQIVQPEAIYDRPIPERHRIVFYRGHLEAFDWNLLSGPCGLTSTQPLLDRLFAFGIDPIDGQLPSDTPRDWPRLEQVEDYRNRVRGALDGVLGKVSNPELLLNVAIEHRLMHAETLAYMFHQMPFERKTRRAVRRVLDAGPWTPASVRVPSGPATLGLRRESDVFGWCNEFEEQTIQVPAFSIDRYKVSNGQFLQFLEEGGYDNRALWTDEDWAWKLQHGIAHPAFWANRDGRWVYRSMFDELALPVDWPVYVSHAEASAYARWQCKRLPTEAEWHRAAEAPAVHHNDPPRDVWDPSPVQSRGSSAYGVDGLFANGWEWTSTQFAPLPGFRSFPFYPGYSADFFDGQHYVLKGGSVRTAACMLRGSFRNWFQPRYQYVYAGFRCVSVED
ncbi:SUMF1/EgtB/PvdO family nonheme iron enzyme [uncultured Paludibaculum sp.]|uniref:SUMF1/EgtB/PvdO family nonheme iron enzyme n=1 Tax=uncultured Paludibaculum sp. TaxID=1765020 RepID=UPI002AAC4533|nr:SUMF1/EgtB/PvdO family nonheme iron enzyme [uncultured Paludibaculum sp.]